MTERGYRFQRRPQHGHGEKTHLAWRLAFENGWHCGHWHASPEAAVQCVGELEDKALEAVYAR